MQLQELKLITLPDLSQFITPLNQEAQYQLEQNILANGCRDPLVVWENNDQQILIDGHHRFEICKKHSVTFNTMMLNFENKEEVKNWMISNQLGRRNLTSDQSSYYRGLRYLSIKKDRGGFDKVQQKGIRQAETSEVLSNELGVSERTIKRDAKYALGLDLIGKSNPQLRKEILKGEVKVKKSDLQLFADAHSEIKVHNVKDLKTKIDQIRKEMLAEVSQSIDHITAEQKELNSGEPIFLKKDEQITQIKGKILSALNNAILSNDPKSLIEIKKLLDKLEIILS